jgi:sterol desaturase/sphingolipid hydroxylase (fatty acid hydroxylase superfamily)
VLQTASSEWWLQAQLWSLIGGLVLFWSLESVRGVPAGGFRARLAHTGNNLGIWIAGVALFSLLVGSSYGETLTWLDASGIGVLHFLSLPAWLSLTIGFLLLDFGDYAFHRLSHRVRWLWLLHAVHHSDNAVDISTNLRQHPIHVLITIGWKLVVIAAVGAPLWLAMARETLLIAIAQTHHAAIDWPPWIEKTIGRLFVSPRAHWVHHSPVDGETDSNFGSVLVLWDRLFGTYVDPARLGIARFGLNALGDARWQSAMGMLLTPIRARKIERL